MCVCLYSVPVCLVASYRANGLMDFNVGYMVSNFIRQIRFETLDQRSRVQCHKKYTCCQNYCKKCFGSMDVRSIRCFFKLLVSIYNILPAIFCNLNKEMFDGYINMKIKTLVTALWKSRGVGLHEESPIYHLSWSLSSVDGHRQINHSSPSLCFSQRAWCT